MNRESIRRMPGAGLQYWLSPLVVSAVLWWLSPNAISVREGIVATILFFIPCLAYGRWRRRPATRIPLFALLALAYWAAYAMPLFLGTPPADPKTALRFAEPDVFAVLLMAVIGVIAMGVGMQVRFRPIRPQLLPDIVETEGTWRYLYCLMALGAVISFRESWGDFGAGGAQLIIGLANIVPMAICSMLTIRVMDGTATRTQRYALAIFVVSRMIAGITAGELGRVVFVVLILGMVYLSERRRLPVGVITVMVPIILFLQVGKSAYRSIYWTEGKSGSILEKTEFWLNASWKEWATVFDRRNHGSASSLFGESVERVALLKQAVNVEVKTPGVVPYQGGKTYSYLAATLVPRAVWPNKPSVNEANQFYQVAYGLTEKENLNTVSIAVGCLAESYMNFGWWGVAPVMFAIGILLGLFEYTLLSYESGLLFSGTGFALLSVVVAVEGQAGQYLGGLLQQIAIVFAVALPVMRRRRPLPGRVYSMPEAVWTRR